MYTGFEGNFQNIQPANIFYSMAPKGQATLDENENAITQLNLATEKILSRIPDIIGIDPSFGCPVYLKCWLTLGQLNTDKTERIIREGMRWRKEKNSEFAITQPLNPLIEKALRLYIDGNSKNGFVVGSAYLGVFKLRDILSKVGVEAGLYHWLQVLGRTEKLCIERSKELSQRYNNEDIRLWPALKKNWFIINAKHLSYFECIHTGVIQMAVALVKMGTSYFPGLEGTIVIINAGRFMELALRAVRPLLTGSNADLIVFGYDELAWKAFIHKHVDPDQLRTPFGGTMEYNDLYNPDKDYMKI
ncbi:unnamed protein product [Allacma fusca]|uniref:CRAL-TRIO domain-containing protein n=1 Tax=Allacma fusca TaxID=39272 RepID=A0A8J2LMS8_9HEXA|nr:unnamed protein product [Allacma fusca]